MARRNGERNDRSTDESFDLFVSRVDEMIDCRLVAGGNLRSTFTLKGGIGQPVELSAHSPDEDQLRSFLLTFRQFVLKGEPVYAMYVANLLWQSLAGHEELCRRLSDGRARYQHGVVDGRLGFILNGTKFTADSVLDMWINGLYFHNDSRKKATLENLDPLSNLLTRQLFLDALVEGARYVIFLANVIIGARAEGLL